MNSSNYQKFVHHLSRKLENQVDSHPALRFWIIFCLLVSFQDDELLEDLSAKEISPAFRRNSVVPVGSRGARQLRPPTAPLNSLFFKDLQQRW